MDCKALPGNKECPGPYHLVIFPAYKEGPEILKPSFEALRAWIILKKK